jgi:predicted transporter
MELKSLILGIFFSMGIFAVKSGLGLHYFLSQKGALKEKVPFVLFFFSLYFSLFLLSAHLLDHMNIMNYFEAFQKVWPSGMCLHILLAGFMALWGIVLLKGRKKTKKDRIGWLAMVIPCPVCLAVVFFSVAFFLACFPAGRGWAIYPAYGSFAGIILLTLILLALWQRKVNAQPEAFLGAAMLLISSYFLLSVIIMPQFNDLGSVYRLAMYKEEAPLSSVELFLLLSVFTAMFMSGFIWKKMKIRRVKLWSSEHF